MAFSRRIIHFASALPKFQGGLIHFLQEVNEHSHSDAEETAMPSGLKLDLESVWLTALVPIERMPQLQSDMLSLHAKHPRRQVFFPTSDSERISDAFEGIRKNPFGSSWSALGSFEPNQISEKPVLPLVDAIYFEVDRCFKSQAVLLIRIAPSDVFRRQFRDFCRAMARDRITFRLPSWRMLFRSWSYRSQPAWIVKGEQLEDMLLDLKLGVADYLARFIRQELFPRNPSLPSFELYVFADSSPTNPSDRAQVRRKESFWNSLDMNRRVEGFCDAGQMIHFFPYSTPVRSERIDTPFRILIDDGKYPANEHYGSRQTQLISHVGNWLRGLIRPWVLYHVIGSLQNELLEFRESFADHAARTFPRSLLFGPLFKQRVKIGFRKLLFQRLDLEYSLKQSLRALRREGVPNDLVAAYTREDPPEKQIKFERAILETVDYAVKDTRVNLDFIARSFDDLVGSRLTYLQWHGFLLSIVALAVSILALSGWTLPEPMRKTLCNIGRLMKLGYVN